MNKDIKKRWVDALRSGKYAQGKDVLHDVENNTYCCLGVLCEIAAEDGVVTKRANSYVTNEEAAYYVLPKLVREWANLTTNDPDVNGGSRLSSLNDIGIPFGQIADIIEKAL